MTNDTTACDPAADGWALVEDKGFIAHAGPLHLRAADGADPSGPSRSMPT